MSPRSQRLPRRKRRKPEFPSSDDVRAVFRARDRKDRAQVELEEVVNAGLRFWKGAKWLKKYRRRLVERWWEHLQAKNDLVACLWHGGRNVPPDFEGGRKISARIEIRSREHLMRMLKTRDLGRPLHFSVVAEGDLIPSSRVGEIYEGGGQIGKKALERALPELVRQGYVYIIMGEQLGSFGEKGQRYYILVPNASPKYPYPTFDAFTERRGIDGKMRTFGPRALIDQMRAATKKKFRIAEGAGRRTPGDEGARTFDITPEGKPKKEDK